ncbi:MAG: glycosyltransferase family 4 protein [Pirellulales bacterium]
MPESHLTSSPEPHTQLSAGRAHLLMIAFACDPHHTMEERNGWHRALAAAENFDVTVLTKHDADVNLLQSTIPARLKPHLQFLPVDAGKIYRRCIDKELFFYHAYRVWQKRAADIAAELNRTKPIDLAHLVSICGYREPGYLWKKLSCPFVWGPIGGTGNFPLSYLSITDPVGGTFEVVRSAANALQLRTSPRIRRAMLSSAAVFAASRDAQRDLAKAVRIGIHADLETGIDFDLSSPRGLTDSDQPLKILWAGRLRTWKALPVLLDALASIKTDTRFELRVLGDGNCLKRWQARARKLGIDPYVQWIRRPAYRNSLEHYQWADLFAFTSLRDTSGTGLLESLATGVPIIGFDHHGARDIMDSSCAIAVPIDNPQHSVDRFADSIRGLAFDRSRLKQLSDGALRRAQLFTWDRRHAVMEAVYRRLLDSRQPIEAASFMADSPSRVLKHSECSDSASEAPLVV